MRPLRNDRARDVIDGAGAGVRRGRSRPAPTRDEIVRCRITGAKRDNGAW